MSDPLLLGAAIVSLVAVGFFLLRAGSAKGSTQDVGVATVVLSSLIVHTVFTLRYAMPYYTGEDGGISFNQQTPPRYSDFAYLAFTIGMTFQVSDTDLQTPTIRATALRKPCCPTSSAQSSWPPPSTWSRVWPAAAGVSTAQSQRPAQ